MNTKELIEHILFVHGVARAYDLTPEQCAKSVVDLNYLTYQAIDLPSRGDIPEELELWHAREHRALESDMQHTPNPTWALSCAYEFGEDHTHNDEIAIIDDPEPLDISHFLPVGDAMPTAGVGQPPIITGHGSPTTGPGLEGWRELLYQPHTSPWMDGVLVDSSRTIPGFRPIKDVPTIDEYGISREAREDYLPEDEEED